MLEYPGEEEDGAGPDAAGPVPLSRARAYKEFWLERE